MPKRARGKVPHGVPPDLWARRQVYVDQAIRELQSLIKILENENNFINYEVDRLVAERVARLEGVLAKEEADASVRWSPASGGDQGFEDPTHFDSLDNDLIMVRHTLQDMRDAWSGLTCWLEPPQPLPAAADDEYVAAMVQNLRFRLHPVTPGQLDRLRAACEGLVAHRGEGLEGDPVADRNRFIY
jgi:hypothetical protein